MSLQIRLKVLPMASSVFSETYFYTPSTPCRDVKFWKMIGLAVLSYSMDEIMKM